MSLLSILKPKGANGFGYGSTAEEVTEGVNLTGKNVLITGCNSGLGKETARVLSKRGATILGAARTIDKAEEVAKDLKIENFQALACELSDPKSVDSCVDRIKTQKLKLDIIICNAGIMALPKLEKAYGYELQFFTNHIGHFLLVKGLLSSLSESARVVMLSSTAHKMAPTGGIDFDNLTGDKGYNPWTAYGQSKMANLLFAKALAKKWEGTEKTAFSLHPGVIQTNLSRHMNPILNFIFGLSNPLFLKSIPEGAATQCYVACSKDIAQYSGSYFADCNVDKPRPDANNPALADKLWKVSEEILQTL